MPVKIIFLSYIGGYVNAREYFLVILRHRASGVIDVFEAQM